MDVLDRHTPADPSSAVTTCKLLSAHEASTMATYDQQIIKISQP